MILWYPLIFVFCKAYLNMECYYDSNHMCIVSLCEPTTAFSYLKLCFYWYFCAFFILKKHAIVYSTMECVYRTFWVVEEEEFKTYISFRLSGSLDFLLGIHMILFTQFLHEHIWLLMPLFTILIVCWSKNNFVLYLTSCMDMKYLLLIYESQS